MIKIESFNIVTTGCQYLKTIAALNSKKNKKRPYKSHPRTSLIIAAESYLRIVNWT